MMEKVSLFLPVFFFFFFDVQTRGGSDSLKLVEDEQPPTWFKPIGKFYLFIYYLEMFGVTCTIAVAMPCTQAKQG